MALKLIHRVPVLQRFKIQALSAGWVCPTKLLSSAGSSTCEARICTSASQCLHKQGCQRLQPISGTTRSLSTIVREPVFIAGSVSLHRDSVPRFRLTQLLRPTEEQAFLKHLEMCSSSSKVFSLLCSVDMLSDTMAAAALHRVADLECKGNALKDPTVLKKDAIRALFFQLEQDSTQLTDAGLVSTLLVCTRLFLDPQSTLTVRLVTECQTRLDREKMTVEQLCVLGQAMLAIEGPSSGILEQVVEQIQQQEPSLWSRGELVSVYGLLQRVVGAEEKCRDLLNAMHTHALTVTSDMDAVAVIGVVNALMTLNQTQAVRLLYGLFKQAAQHVPSFTDEELTHVLRAQVHFGFTDRNFVQALGQHIPTVAFTSHPETISTVMEFLSQRNILLTTALDVIADSFVYRADDYTTSQVASHITAFAKLGYLPPNASQVFRKLESILDTRFSHFQPQTLIDVLHACTVLERYPLNFVSKVFSNFFLQQLKEPRSVFNRRALEQLTQLFMTLKLECPYYEAPKLPYQYYVKSFFILETPVDSHLYYLVRTGLNTLLGSPLYFRSKFLTPYCYTLDVMINLDKEGYVLSPGHTTQVSKRIVLCIDGRDRFTSNRMQLLGNEAIKQRHLRLLGYEVVQIPFYEFENKSKPAVVEYLHQKIFPYIYRLNWE